MSSSRNFLLRYAPDCTFSSRNMKNLPTVGGMSYFQFHTSLPIYYMSSSRNFLLRYAPDCTFSSRNMKNLPTVGGRTPPSHTLSPLGRYAPSGLVASLPRKDGAPQMFWLITPLLYSMHQSAPF